MNFTTDSLHFKGSRVLIHIIFWAAYLGFFIVQSSLYYDDPDYPGIIGSLFMTMWVDIAAAYFTVYYLFPKYLFKKKYLLFALLFLLSAAVAILIQRVLLVYISYPIFWHESGKVMTFWKINPFYSFMNIYSVVGLFAAIKLFKLYFKNQQIKTELENKNKTSELALLRTQINPHFLFNTLNNIDTLITTKPEKASEAIIKLSEIMRFTLYDADNDRVPLEKEIAFLKNFIALQQLRLKNPFFVNFDIDGKCTGKSIAPMLFIPFVENAFKHGLKRVVAPGIEIKLNCENQTIVFEVSNHFTTLDVQNKDKTSGIGLANTRKRLALLYPGKHNLTIKQKEGIFKVVLQIDS
jgi:sensor histidine kinase YesM